MAEERLIRTDADTIVGTPLCPEATELTNSAQHAIKIALVAKIVAERLAARADEVLSEYFEDLRTAVDTAGVVSWDDPTEILPLWESPPDDLLEEVLSERAADEFRALVQILDGDLMGENIATGLSYAPNENEIVIAQSALTLTVRPPLDD